MFWCTWFAVTFSKMIIEVYPFIHCTLSGLLNLILPGGAGGPEYLASDYFQRAWLPFRCSAFRFGWSFVQRTSVLRCWIMVSECLKDKGSLSFCHTCFLWMFLGACSSLAWLNCKENAHVPYPIIHVRIQHTSCSYSCPLHDIWQLDCKYSLVGSTWLSWHAAFSSIMDTSNFSKPS